MATRLTPRSTNRQQDDGLSKLIQLLNEEQPYKAFDRLQDPELGIEDDEKIRKIQGALIGLAIGDALGASVEFRPNAYLKQNPVKDMQSGGTWGLQAGQWTDDTSMALCLAASLIVKGESDPYDQFVRYKRWYKYGYMSSTGKCFDIGKSTRLAINEFENRQSKVASILVAKKRVTIGSSFDEVTRDDFRECGFDIKCGTSDSAGNGSLMRLAPIPSFFFQSYDDIKQNIEETIRLTHGDQRAIDACRFYAGLIWHAINGVSRDKLLDQNFYQKNLDMDLHNDVLQIIRRPYKNLKGYEDGIRGKGYVLNTLEAALWAFHNDNGSFQKGVLDAVNLGDDTDTTAAIYGQLAGAVYGIENIPEHWIKQLFQEKFIKTIAKGLYVKGKQLHNGQDGSDNSDRNERKHGRNSANNTRDRNQRRNETSTKGSDQSNRVNDTSYEITKDNNNDALHKEKNARIVTES